MKNQSSTFPKKPTSTLEMFANENYLYKAQDTGFGREILTFSKMSRSFKEQQRNRLTDLKRINTWANLKKIQTKDW